MKPLFTTLFLLFGWSPTVHSETFNLPHAYWYSTDLFVEEIFIGDIEIIGSNNEGPTGDKKLEYRFQITEILAQDPSKPSRYKVGDIIQSETLRKIENKSAVICLSAYPEPGKPVIDGAFPLLIDETITKALGIIRKHGIDYTNYPAKEFESVVNLTHNPEMVRFIRKKNQEQAAVQEEPEEQSETAK